VYETVIGPIIQHLAIYHGESMLHDTCLDPDFGQDRDLRSTSHAFRRQQKKKQKYYGFRGVKESWPGQETICPSNSPAISLDESCVISTSGGHGPPAFCESEEIPTRTWTKQDQWAHREYDIWPLDRTHHVGRRYRSCGSYVPPRWEDERKMKKKRIETQDIEQAYDILHDENTEQLQYDAFADAALDVGYSDAAT